MDEVDTEENIWMLFNEANLQGHLNDSAWRNTSDLEAVNFTSLLLAAAAKRDGDVFRIVVEALNIYFTPIIIVVGLVGNMLSFLVFSFTHLQRLSSSFYLSTLALADIGFLIGISFVWLERISVPIFTREGWCQCVIYVTKFCGFLAFWTVVGFTAERYIIVYHPLRKDTFCTKKKARMVVCGLVIFSGGLYTYAFWIYDVITLGAKSVCSPLPRYYHIYTIMTSIDTLCACVIPSFVIVILNVRIIIKIHQFQSILKRGSESRDVALLTAPEHPRRRSVVRASISTTGSMHIKFISPKPHLQATNNNQLLHPEEYSLHGLAGMVVGGSAGPHETIALGGADTTTPGETLGLRPSEPADKCQRLVRSRSQFRTARMLLILSSVVVLLNLPGHLIRVQELLQNFIGTTSKAPKHIFILHKLFNIIYFLNFATNFFIYSVCGRQFRTGLRRLCRRWRYKMTKCGQLLHLGRRLRNRRRERAEEIAMEYYNTIKAPKHR